MSVLCFKLSTYFPKGWLEREREKKLVGIDTEVQWNLMSSYPNIWNMNMPWCIGITCILFFMYTLPLHFTSNGTKQKFSFQCTDDWGALYPQLPKYILCSCEHVFDIAIVTNTKFKQEFPVWGKHFFSDKLQ